MKTLARSNCLFFDKKNAYRAIVANSKTIYTEHKNICYRLILYIKMNEIIKGREKT